MAYLLTWAVCLGFGLYERLQDGWDTIADGWGLLPYVTGPTVLLLVLLALTPTLRARASWRRGRLTLTRA